MNKIQKYLPPSVMLPPDRLHTLLNQALELQALHCSHHNTVQAINLENSSLLVDHCCAKETFPTHTIQVTHKGSIIENFCVRFTKTIINSNILYVIRCV